LNGIGQWPLGSTYVEYGDGILGTGRYSGLLGNVGGQPFAITNPGSGQTSGVYTTTANCSTVAGFILGKMDITVSGGVIINAYPSTANGSLGQGMMGACTFTPSGTGGTPGSVTIPLAPVEGLGGVATFNTDANMFGDMLYDNSGLPGNPLNSFFSCAVSSGYCEPGLPVKPFGLFLGAAVSG
jgi:hypothetical protein